MGINIFVEGNPFPFVMKVRFTRNIDDLKGLKEVTAALSLVDQVFHKEWASLWKSTEYRIKKTETRVISFRVDSPPELQIFTDPGWLGVLVTILINYKGTKDSIAELAKDSEKIKCHIKGLTEREWQLLNIAVKLTLDRILESGEKNAFKFAVRCAKIRRQLIGSNDKPVEIEIKKSREHL